MNYSRFKQYLLIYPKLQRCTVKEFLFFLKQLV